ncbi:hypothetical protein FA95DRAFT_1562396, partial [Auriscalpium vulgare]
MSFLYQILCCVRPRADSTSEPDERTRLIPPTEDTSPAQRHVVIDHQRMKERLTVIVRSKESKMVNLNAALPFNLHNKALHGRLDPSTSRSGRGPSPQPSVETSQSSGSLSAHPGYEEEPRRPILGVRIVRRTGSSTLGAARRGRSSVRGVRTNPAPPTQSQGETKSYADAAREGLSDGNGGEGLAVDEDGEAEPSPGQASDVGSLTRSWG